MTVLKSILLVALAIYLLAGLGIYFFQELFIFFPEALDPGHHYSFDADFEEQFIEMKDGGRINALYFKHPNPKGMILYLHGNAGNLDRWGCVVAPFTQLGYEVYIIDYRGYGKSTGVRSKKALLSDMLAVYQHVLQYTDEDRLIIYGRSLGTSFASYLAGQHSPLKLILEAPFYSIADMAKRKFPLFPHKWLLKYDLDNHESLKNASCPIHIFHGTADDVIPYASGKRLKDSLFFADVQFISIQNGGHNDLIDFEEYNEGILGILNYQ